MSDELLARLDERVAALDKKADEILEQAKRTNGRVDALEATSDRLKGAVGVLMALVVPVAIALVTKYLT